MHVQAAYHCHRDLLELLKHFSDAHIIERLRRGGPHHMSSLLTCTDNDSSDHGGVAHERARSPVHIHRSAPVYAATGTVLAILAARTYAVSRSRPNDRSAGFVGGP